MGINTKTIIISLLALWMMHENKQKKIKSVLKKLADIFYVKVRVCLWFIWALSTWMPEQRKKHSLNAIWSSILWKWATINVHYTQRASVKSVFCEMKYTRCFVFVCLHVLQCENDRITWCGNTIRTVCCACERDRETTMAYLSEYQPHNVPF